MPKAPPLDIRLLAETMFEAFDNAAIGVVVTADDGDRARRIYVNAAAARMAGRSREDLLATAGGSLLLTPEAEAMERIRVEVLAGGRPPSSFDARIEASDGRVVPIHVGIAAARYGGVPVSVAFIQDRTEARAAQEALAASEERFRKLAEVAPDLIVVISDHRLVYANPDAVRVLGFRDMDELLARPLPELVADEDFPRLAERVAGILRGEHLVPTEYRARRKDGSFALVEISSVASTYDGRPAVVGFGRDVSERKALLQRSLQQDRLAAVGTLAAGVAHEINNPLSYALLNLQMLRLRAGATSGSNEARLLDQSLEGLERVRRIVQDLLAFARPSEDVVETIDVAQVVGSAIRLARTTTDRSARVEAEVDGLPLVRTNGARLGQVLLNVLVNALQALDGRTDGEVRVAGSACSVNLRIEVRDNGPGIPPEVLERVFEPFFTTKPVGQGTGLGLTVSHAIVMSLGGTLDVLSEVGAGTTVRIEIPLRPPATEGAREAAPPVSEARARVLVVDDDRMVAGALVAFLEDEHDAVACFDPEAAVGLLTGDQNWDVVLCDVRMPRMSGPELFERVRARRPDVAGRFVFVTGGILEGADARIVAANGCRVLNKPVPLQVLLDTIRGIAAR